MNDISAEILRIIDANINRTGEGLRVIEEFARLALNDTALTQRLKNLRHNTLHFSAGLQKQLLQYRDAAADVGNSMDVPGEIKSRGAAEVIIANSRRVQESLRVLEELSKTAGIGLDSEKFRQGRFEIYTLEKELLSRLTRNDKVRQIIGLYVVIDAEWFKGRQPQDIANQVINGGAKVIQLRCKTLGAGEFFKIAESLKAICSQKGVLFIVNDSLEVALASHADGLHIGQEDIPVKIARKLMPVDMLLGVSVRTKKEAALALEEGADYLGAGAIFSTTTKDSSAIGLGALKEIIKTVNLPVVAIGGINKDNIKSVFDTGAASAAVISAVLGADDVEKAAAQLVKRIEG